MQDLVSSLNTALFDSPITSDSIINSIDVKAAASGLKSHKREGLRVYSQQLSCMLLLLTVLVFVLLYRYPKVIIQICPIAQTFAVCIKLRFW